MNRLESGVEGWVKRGGEAGRTNRSAGEGGPLSQQYKAAAAFLQSIFEKGEQVGPGLDLI